jgi:hypothetical protein
MCTALRLPRQADLAISLVGLAITAAALAGCGGSVRLPLEAGMGPHPQIPRPEKSLLPTLHVAPAKGWPPHGIS